MRTVCVLSHYGVVSIEAGWFVATLFVLLVAGHHSF